MWSIWPGRLVIMTSSCPRTAFSSQADGPASLGQLGMPVRTAQRAEVLTAEVVLISLFPWPGASGSIQTICCELSIVPQKVAKAPVAPSCPSPGYGT
jgi:hypothetical protein